VPKIGTGRRSGRNILRRMSANDEPADQTKWTRRWLVEWSTLACATYSEAKSGDFKPSLAIDVCAEDIRVIDLKTDART
jgi:hypothetical protein